MNQVENQHIIPRVYLKGFHSRFSTPENPKKKKNYFIYVLDKKTGKIEEKNIEKVACEKEFYNLISENQEIEDLLKNFENDFGLIIKKISRDNSLKNLSSDEMEKLISFVALQSVRDDFTRKSLIYIGGEIYNRCYSQATEELKAKIEEIRKPESIRNTQNNLIKEFKLFKEILSTKKFILIKNKTKLPFITSDHPCRMWNCANKSLGLAVEGTTLDFPLTSNLMIGFSCPIYFRENSSEVEIDSMDKILLQWKIFIQHSIEKIYSPIDINQKLGGLKNG